VEAPGDPPLPEGFEPRWNWRGCETCGHLFTEGHPDGAALASLHQLPWQPGDPGRGRRESGELVHRVALLRGTLEGDWLDVEAGQGTLLASALEFGYRAQGIDPRRAAVAHLQSQDLPAQVAGIEAVQGRELFDVISFWEGFETLAFPAEALQAVARLLRPGGILAIRVPNVDSLPWREMDAAQSNPYWGDPRRLHHFSREHLYWLLRRNGFEPCDFMVSASLAAGMEVCATFKDEAP